MAAYLSYEQEFLHLPNRISARNTNVVRVIGTRFAGNLARLVRRFLRHGYGGRHPFSLVRGTRGALYAILNTERDAAMLDRRIYLINGAVVGFVAVARDAPDERASAYVYIRLY